MRHDFVNVKRSNKKQAVSNKYRSELFLFVGLVSVFLIAF